jgi:hypothetical protein
MGASFILHALPDVKNKTDERLTQMTEIIDNLSHDDLAILRYDCAILDEATDDSIKDALVDDLEDYWMLEDSGREHGSMHLPGCNLSYVFTGGSSWGDPPTELSDGFDLLSSCGQIFDQLKEWATADLMDNFSKR